MGLAGKTAIITGAASGIGRSMVTRFVDAGANVVAVDVHTERLDETVQAVVASGGSIAGVPGDVSVQNVAESLVGVAIKAFGSVDVLVNNAGVMDYMQGVGELDDDIWRRVFSTDLDAVMFTSRSAVRHMKSNGGGAIVNVASAAGSRGGAAGVAYTAAKHGVVGLTRHTAWAYVGHGIRCNAICPGSTDTNIVESMPEDRVDAVGGARAGVLGALVPRLLDPDEIARLGVFLASDDSSALNGAIIAADSGWGAG
jgi:NAD(P)-dependent dehydrogenase (short-subunit alcohol dehydrogenase family)